VSDPLETLAGITDEAWLVGGALRDRLLERPTSDFDVTVKGDPKPIAKALARAANGHAFELSEAFSAWRVVSRRQGWQVDLMPLEGGSLEADLARRDFTINALAEPIGSGEPIDLFGGLGDLRARRLRMVTPGAFEQDPLRTLRMARLASELEFHVEAKTAAVASRSVSGLSGV
jgi:poly(A) polymerase